MKCWDQNWWTEAPSVRGASANTQLLLLPAANKVPVESSCRYKDSLVLQTDYPGNASSHVLYSITRVKLLQKQNGAQRIASFPFFMNKMSSISGFLLRSVFSMNVSVTFQDLETHRITVIRAHKPKKEMQHHELHVERVSLWCELCTPVVL